jgi:hypothetical protein
MPRQVVDGRHKAGQDEELERKRSAVLRPFTAFRGSLRGGRLPKGTRLVLAGLDPAIHDFNARQVVDARHKAGQDEVLAGRRRARASAEAWILSASGT